MQFAQQCPVPIRGRRRNLRGDGVQFAAASVSMSPLSGAASAGGGTAASGHGTRGCEVFVVAGNLPLVLPAQPWRALRSAPP
ncbi:hypothetical protein ACP70R_005999 [Stipagrostis hirtigluma subsp. patula]